MTRKIITGAACALLVGGLALMPGASAQTGKRIYCWNEDGKRVCGDALPAEAASAAREEINARTGLTTRQVDRALTPEERAALSEQQATAQEQAESQAERTRRAMAMVDAYDSPKAVSKSYDQRIVLAQARKTSTEQGITQARAHLVGLLRKAGDIELSGNKVPPKQVEAILKGRGNVLALQDQAQAQEEEIQEIQQEREEAVALYLEFTQAQEADEVLPASSTAP